MRQLPVILLTALVASAGAQSVAQRGTSLNDQNAERPIDAVDSVFIEELTWMEVRDAAPRRQEDRDRRHRRRRAERPVPRHRQAQRRAARHHRGHRPQTRQCARRADRCLRARGQIDPPSGAMRYPGTISLQETTFRALLTDIAVEPAQHGFENIVLIGDSGGNQAGMKHVAASSRRSGAASPGSTSFPSSTTTARQRNSQRPSWASRKETRGSMTTTSSRQSS